MSLQAAIGVWARARAEGMDLLLLLAIADFADVDGRNAWPTVATLATRVRLRESEVLQLLHQLEQAGEVVVERTADMPPTSPPTRYHIRCCYDPLYDQR